VTHNSLHQTNLFKIHPNRAQPFSESDELLSLVRTFESGDKNQIERVHLWRKDNKKAAQYIKLKPRV